MFEEVHFIFLVVPLTFNWTVCPSLYGCGFTVMVSISVQSASAPYSFMVQEACKLELLKPKDMMRNCVRDIYKPFSTEEINQKVAEMLRPEGLKTPVELVFQSIAREHQLLLYLELHLCAGARPSCRAASPHRSA